MPQSPNGYSPILWLTQRMVRVCELRRVSWEDFCSKSRHPRVIETRGLAYALCRDYQGPGCAFASYPEIAASCGRRGHSSVRGSVERVRADRDKWAEVTRLAVEMGLARTTEPEMATPLVAAPSAALVASAPPPAHVLRCCRRLIDDLCDGTHKNFEDAQRAARALSEVYPTDEQCVAFSKRLGGAA